MKKILFINPGPFGSLTDTYYYYLHLKDKYNITYLGCKEDYEIRAFEDINLIHLDVKSNFFMKKIAFYKRIILLINSSDYEFILVNYFLGCSIINGFSKKKVIIDIRTSVIHPNRYNRLLFNSILSFEAKFFDSITIISKGLKGYLKLPEKSHVLPLGAPKTPLITKSFDKLKLLYVGTFHERNIIITIYGFSKFVDYLNDENVSHYTIIGNGSDMEISNIKNAIISAGMEKHISFIGVVRHPKLLTYLENHNVGMSYIPIKEHFQNQPPTKTFEYLLSGMAVIATGTLENKRIITNNNGVVIDDSIEDVYQGLVQIYNNRLQYNSEEIQKEAEKYSWETIVKENLIPFIERLNSY